MSERCQHADTVAAYLLGALVDAERTQFEAHLAGCAQCREDVATLRVVTEALPLAVEPVAPPPQLREVPDVEPSRSALQVGPAFRAGMSDLALGDPSARR